MKSTLVLAVLLCIAVAALFPSAEAKEEEVRVGSDEDADYLSTDATALEAIKSASRKLMKSDSDAGNELDHDSTGFSMTRGLLWGKSKYDYKKYDYKKYYYYYYDHGKKYYYTKPYYYYGGKKYYSNGYYYHGSKKYYYYKYDYGYSKYYKHW